MIHGFFGPHGTAMEVFDSTVATSEGEVLFKGTDVAFRKAPWLPFFWIVCGGWVSNNLNKPHGKKDGTIFGLFKLEQFEPFEQHNKPHG